MLGNHGHLRIVIAIFIVFCCTIISFGQSKIGYVDSQKILSTFVDAIDAQKKLEAENGQWEQELRKMNDALTKLNDELEQKSLLLSEEKKKEKEQEIQAEARRIQQFQNQKWGENGEYFKRRSELYQPVIEKINRVIHRIGEEEEYDFIFDTVAGNILHGNEKYDLTDMVLSELEKEPTTSTQTQRRD